MIRLRVILKVFSRKIKRKAQPVDLESKGGVLMILDKWLSGEIVSISLDIVEQALDELEGEGEKVRHLAQSGEYWDAWIRLTACITFLNVASQQHPTRQPAIIQRLLNWIQKIKGAINKIVKGIGGSGYSLGVSAPFGISISVSFTVEVTKAR